MLHLALPCFEDYCQYFWYSRFACHPFLTALTFLDQFSPCILMTPVPPYCAFPPPRKLPTSTVLSVCFLLLALLGRVARIALLDLPPVHLLVILLFLQLQVSLLPSSHCWAADTEWCQDCRRLLVHPYSFTTLLAPTVAPSEQVSPSQRHRLQAYCPYDFIVHLTGLALTARADAAVSASVVACDDSASSPILLS